MSSRKRTPDQPSTENPIATAEPPAAATDNGAAHDNQPSRDKQVAIKFGEGRPEDKPSQQVIDKLKEHGYHWQPANRVWAHPYGDMPRTVRIEGERLYHEIRQIIRGEKGIETGREIPF